MRFTFTIGIHKNMAQQTNLYSILLFYARKRNSPRIDAGAFIQFLEKHARAHVYEQADLQKWINDTGKKVWAELPKLVDEKKCKILSSNKGSSILMLHFFTDIILQAYDDSDKKAGLPFPNGVSLKLSIPQDQIRSLFTAEDIPSYMENPQQEPLPVIKLVFPGVLGEALVLPSLIPKQLLETALLKIRNYLRSENHTDHAMHALSLQIPKKEISIKQTINQILIRPLDCLKGIENGEEFPFVFWAYFCALVKNTIKIEEEVIPEDIATLQAAYLIECFNGYYKSTASRERNREMALKTLEYQFNQPPFYYSMDEILKFTDHQGVPLLGKYSQAELEAYIKRKTTERQDQELPELLIIKGPDGGRRLIKKANIPPLCMKLIIETGPQIKRMVVNRWVKLCKEFQKEPAMEENAAFENLLKTYTRETAPVLMSLLDDPKLRLIYEDMETQGETTSDSVLVFNKLGNLRPLSELFLLTRKDLLADTRSRLPFWYSVPVLVALMTFFNGVGSLFSKKKKTGDDEDDEYMDAKAQGPTLRSVAADFAASTLPEGCPMDTYLRNLENRWQRLLDQGSQKDLVDNVQGLIKDRLRYILRTQNYTKVTKNVIVQIASNISLGSPILKQLSSEESMQQYIQLYVTKLLMGSKI